MALTKLNARSATALDATILTGNLPALNGSSLTNLVAGKVGQVVSAHRSTVNSFSSSSTSSFADLGISLDITPSATSSKILIMSLVNITQSTSSTIHVQLLRDSTTLGQFISIGGETEETTRNDFGSSCFFYLDSPSTTSEIVYYVQLATRVAGQAVYVGNYYSSGNKGGATMTAFEIAG